MEYTYEDLVREEEEEATKPQAPQEDPFNSGLTKVENIINRVVENVPSLLAQIKASKDEISEAAIGKANAQGLQPATAEKIKGIQATMIKNFTKDREKLLRYILILLDELSTKFGDQVIKEIRDEKGKIKETVLVRHGLKELITYMNADQNKQMVIDTIDQRLSIMGV